MEIKELRVGNKIQDEHGFIYDVVGTGKDWITVDFEGNEGDVWEVDFKHSFPQPIEINEEILLKCGFKHKGNGFYEILGYFIELCNVGNEFYNCGFKGKTIGEIKHLHQLQNLYFCLVGEELNIEL